MDLLAFANTNTKLRQEVDNFFCGFLIPGILGPEDQGRRRRGVMHAVVEDRGFGFITLRTGLGADDQRHDIFCHITDVTRHDGIPVDNNYLAGLKHRETVLEFDLVETEEGLKAVNVQEYRWWR